MKRLVALFFSLSWICSANLIADRDIDHEMRVAYQKWDDAVLKYNLETTPAYDVVGLAAAMGRMDLFKEEAFNERDSELVRSKKFLLKNTDSNQLSYIFSPQELSKLRLPDNLLLITDFGEECDDEVTVLLANRLVKLGVNVTLLFTTEHFKEQKAKYDFWSSQLDPLKFKKAQVHSIQSFPIRLLKKVFPETTKRKTRKSTVNAILQIGPIHGRTKDGKLALVKLKNSKALASVNYDFFLLGQFALTLNSQKDGEEATKLLTEHARRTYVIDTKNGDGAFKFTPNALATLFGPKHDIINYVIKIGWRNTVGRAFTFAGRFVGHLVAAHEKGANYQTVFGLVKQLEANKVEAPFAKLVDLNKAKRLAEEYLRRLQVTAPQKLSFLRLTVDSNGITNTKIKATAKEIVEGYTFILTQMKAYFGVPIEFFESGSPESWKKQWDYPSLEDAVMAHEKNVDFKITIPVPEPSL